MRAAEPMQYASGYQLDLYCDQVMPRGTEGQHIGSAQFYGETFSGCSRQAKKRGWKIRRADRTATCPTCMKRIKGI